MPVRLRTPLALAVLNLLYEQSLHPYEMQQRMRERGHDRVIKLKGSSLYSTIERLATAGLIVAEETRREGRRPERTVYALTEAGKHEVGEWLRELIARPTPDYPWFGSALAFLAAIPPEDALSLLEQRAILLDAEVAAEERVLTRVAQMGLPRLFAVETEYTLAMRRAELDWVRQIVADIRDRHLVWPAEVIAIHTGQRDTAVSKQMEGADA